MPDAGPSRRRVLVALGLAPFALTGCGLLGGADDGPDPLLALVAAARADAALAAAVVAAEPDLAERVDPLVAARTEHAAALDAEVRRLDPGADPPPPPPPAAAPATLAALRDAVAASGTAAGDAALELPAERIGLVAAVAACCTTYAAVLA
jgi:hypothetical protein